MYKTMTEMLQDARTACMTLNAAMLTDSMSEVKTAKEATEKAIKEYNDAAKIAVYKELQAASKPMIAAISRLNIKGIKLKINVDKDTKLVTYSIDDEDRQIVLANFEEFVAREKLQIAVNPLWKHYVERFCLLMTYRVMKENGGDTRRLEDTYYISEQARNIEMGKTPMSNTAMLKQMQMIVDAIIYEADGDKNLYKVTSHHVAYIHQTMTRRAKSGVVAAPRSSTMHTLIMDILHMIVMDKAIQTEFTTKKDVRDNPILASIEVMTDENVILDDSYMEKLPEIF